MNGPNQPLEPLPHRDFLPPFCPWPECPSNRVARVAAHFLRHGSYRRAVDGQSVPRFRCRPCRRTCSRQTFSCTYYLKRPELPVEVAAGLVAGSAHRQLARSRQCAPSTVTHLAARLGRHALLLQAHLLERIDGLGETVGYDDFESFTYSQDHPFGMGTAVGQRSSFVYDLEWAPHRRGGRSARKKTPGREHRQSGVYRRACRKMLDVLLPLVAPGERLRLVTDGHTAYRAALDDHPARQRIDHEAYPNPPRGPKGTPRSAAARRRDRAMFEVDLLHKLIRHSQAHHRRETIAFGRRLNALLERGFLLSVWRNLIKARSERRPSPTPAMVLGLTDRAWDWSRVLGRRLFHWRVRVPRHWMQVYRRELITSCVGPNRRHRAVNAF